MTLAKIQQISFLVGRVHNILYQQMLDKKFKIQKKVLLGILRIYGL